MKRLDFLASLLHDSKVVLDIGTDHGLVLKKAFDQEYIERGIATDINAMPLSSAKKNLAGYNVDFYFSDGFKNVKENDYDTVVIAGMGAHLISDILKYANKNAKYILQANEKNEILRQALVELGFSITDEYVIFDDFYYVIIIASFGDMELSEEDLYLGPVLKEKPDRINYYKHKIDVYQRNKEKADLITKEKYQKIIGYYQNNLSKQK